MRRVFLLSLLLVALSLLIPWLAVTLAPAGEEASPPAPSVPVSDNVAPDGATPITALCGDARHVVRIILAPLRAQCLVVLVRAAAGVPVADTGLRMV